MIEGLTALDTHYAPDRMVGSKFALPATFDTKKWASKWVENGPEIEDARQPQIIASANMQAQGWEVFKTLDLEAVKKDQEDGGKSKIPKMIPVLRVAGKKTYILMCRPKALQMAVNDLYAKESRDRLNGEIMGETATANETGDSGILTNQDLKRVSRSYGEDDTPTPIPAGGGKTTQPNRASELVLQ